MHALAEASGHSRIHALSDAGGVAPSAWSLELRCFNFKAGVDSLHSKQTKILDDQFSFALFLLVKKSLLYGGC